MNEFTFWHGRNYEAFSSLPSSLSSSFLHQENKWVIRRHKASKRLPQVNDRLPRILPRSGLSLRNRVCWCCGRWFRFLPRPVGGSGVEGRSMCCCQPTHNSSLSARIVLLLYPTLHPRHKTFDVPLTGEIDSSLKPGSLQPDFGVNITKARGHTKGNAVTSAGIANRRRMLNYLKEIGMDEGRSPLS